MGERLSAEDTWMNFDLFMSKLADLNFARTSAAAALPMNSLLLKQVLVLFKLTSQYLTSTFDFSL